MAPATLASDVSSMGLPISRRQRADIALNEYRICGSWVGATYVPNPAREGELFEFMAQRAFVNMPCGNCSGNVVGQSQACLIASSAMGSSDCVSR